MESARASSPVPSYHTLPPQGHRSEDNGCSSLANNQALAMLTLTNKAPTTVKSAADRQLILTGANSNFPVAGIQYTTTFHDHQSFTVTCTPPGTEIGHVKATKKGLTITFNKADTSSESASAYSQPPPAGDQTLAIPMTAVATDSQDISFSAASDRRPLAWKAATTNDPTSSASSPDRTASIYPRTLDLIDVERNDLLASYHSHRAAQDGDGRNNYDGTPPSILHSGVWGQVTLLAPAGSSGDDSLNDAPTGKEGGQDKKEGTKGAQQRWRQDIDGALVVLLALVESDVRVRMRKQGNASKQQDWEAILFGALCRVM